MRRRFSGFIGVGAVVTALVAGCADDGAVDVADPGSTTEATTVKNARVVPLFVPGSCSLQVGNTADLRFAVTNSRENEEERLLAISTDVADMVRISPTDVLVIPAGTTISAGRPVARFDPESNRKPLEVKLVGIDPDMRPGVSPEMVFRFAEAGDVSVRAPVQECPAES